MDRYDRDCLGSMVRGGVGGCFKGFCVWVFGSLRAGALEIGGRCIGRLGCLFSSLCP